MEKSNRNDEFQSLDELCEKIIELGEKILGNTGFNESNDDRKSSCTCKTENKLALILCALEKEGVLVNFLRDDDKGITIGLDFVEHDKKVVDEFIDFTISNMQKNRR